MKTTIKLPKIGYNNSNRKINAVTIDLKLVEKECINFETGVKETMFVFSASAAIWNSKNTDIVAGGQMLDELPELYKGNSLVKQIVEIWKEYHLNDLQAGTKIQTSFVKQYFKDNNLKYDYKDACEYLTEIGMIEDCGFKYGHQWLCKPIPSDIVETIKNIIENN